MVVMQIDAAANAVTRSQIPVTREPTGIVLGE
jgi:hypothetical protein